MPLPLIRGLNNTIVYRIIYRMKITALLPDRLIEDVKGHAKGKNTTESLIKALSEWIQMQKIKKLNDAISMKPLKFREGFSPGKTRIMNRS